MKVDQAITEDEAALYDRQIRLWGIDAQKRLLASRILLINIQGMGAEIAKNLVLSGINSLTLLDSNDATESDVSTNFLIPRSNIGKNRAEACVESLQTLNPLVKIVSDSQPVEDKDEAFFNKQNFDLVCALTNDLTVLKRVNALCRQNNVLFLCSYVHGLYGYMFVDFNKYQFIAESAKIAEDSEVKKSDAKSEKEKLALEERNLEFKSFETFLQDYAVQLESLSANKVKRLSKAYLVLWLINSFYAQFEKPFSDESDEDKQRLLQVKKSLFEKLKLNDEILSDSYLSDKIFGEFCPVNAILGGIVAQEVIKAISKKNEPIDNFFVFDGNSMSGDVMRI